MQTSFSENETPSAPIDFALGIQVLRGHRVLLDSDLAHLYGVETKVLNQSVKRNLDRFPSDFMFKLTTEETAGLRSQSVTSNGRGGSRVSPYVFTEQGVAMLSTVLSSPRAIAVNIEIMRAFVRLRQVLAQHADLAKRIDGLEAQMGKHQGENEHHFLIVFEAIQRLIDDEAKGLEAGKIGFDTE